MVRFFRQESASRITTNLSTNDSLNTIFKQGHIKVDKHTQPRTFKSQISQKLCLINRFYLCYGLEFNYY